MTVVMCPLWMSRIFDLALLRQCWGLTRIFEVIDAFTKIILDLTCLAPSNDLDRVWVRIVRYVLESYLWLCQCELSSALLIVLMSVVYSGVQCSHSRQKNNEASLYCFHYVFILYCFCQWGCSAGWLYIYLNRFSNKDVPEYNVSLYCKS